MALIISNTFNVNVVDILVENSTFHSIGIKWDLPASPNAQDVDYDATVSVEYKKSINSTWKNAKDLFRQDYAWYYGVADPYVDRGPAIEHFAGSIMFLTPGTQYDVRLTYNDPDNTDDYDGVVYNFQTTTRAIPVKPTTGTTYYVDNSTSPGGDGSSGNPWQNIVDAQSTVTPGDIVRIRSGAGVYEPASLTTPIITTSGAADNWIVYEEDPADPGAIIEAMPVARGINYVWVDGLTFEWQGTETDPYQRLTDEDTNGWWTDAGIYTLPSTALGTDNDGWVVTDSTVTNYVNNIFSPYPCANWTLMDNYVEGYWAVDDWINEDISSGGGVGIGLGGEGQPGGPGHVIAYNEITLTGDAIANGGYTNGSDCDVYGNKIHDTLGNSVSFDNSYHNMRCYGNIMMKCGSFPVTMQPQRSGPWYYLYNQITLSDNANFKWKVQDKLVFINNTFHPGYTQEGQMFTRCFMRNNLFLTELQFCWTTKDDFPIDNNGSAESQWFTDKAASPKAGAPDVGDGWMGDVDYDGFDRGSTSNIMFRWGYDSGTATTDFNDANPATLFANFYDEVGMEEHGIEVDADLIFVSKTYDDPDSLLVLKSNVAYGSPGNPAIEAGQAVDNLADFYGGSAPDLGCHDQVNGLPHYGIRTSELSLALNQRTEHWIKH